MHIPLVCSALFPRPDRAIPWLAVPEEGVMGAADLVLDKPTAGRAVELPESDRIVDEALGVADERVGGLERRIDPERVRLG